MSYETWHVSVCTMLTYRNKWKTKDSTFRRSPSTHTHKTHQIFFINMFPGFFEVKTVKCNYKCFAFGEKFLPSQVERNPRSCVCLSNLSVYLFIIYIYYCLLSKLLHTHTPCKILIHLSSHRFYYRLPPRSHSFKDDDMHTKTKVLFI